MDNNIDIKIEYPVFNNKKSFCVKAILAFNKLFKPVKHPFNMANEGEMTYAEWQFEKGADTIKCFGAKYKPYEMFENKHVLDLGCGAAGKSLYYLTLGAERVVGVDIIERYEREASDFAKKLDFSEKFLFLKASAVNLPYPDNVFDSIIMNDFMEHTAEPEQTIAEAYRIIAPGGRIYINFPPYGHPYGAHLSDLIAIPWVHKFSSEKDLIGAYKILAKDLPDEKERLNLRFSRGEDGREHIAYINKMTLKRFKKTLSLLELEPVYYIELPLRKWLAPLTKLPFLRESFVRMAVCVIEKQKVMI